MRFQILRALVACCLLLVIGTAAGCSSLFPFDQDSAGTRESGERVSYVVNVSDAPSHVYGGASNAAEGGAIGGESSEGTRSGTASPTGTSSPSISIEALRQLLNGTGAGSPPAGS